MSEIHSVTASHGRYTVTMVTLSDGRQHASVLNHQSPRNAFNPREWATVRNIDGSNRFMPTDGSWQFMDSDDAELMAAVQLARKELMRTAEVV